MVSTLIKAILVVVALFLAFNPQLLQSSGHLGSTVMSSVPVGDKMSEATTYAQQSATAPIWFWLLLVGVVVFAFLKM